MGEPTLEAGQRSIGHQSQSAASATRPTAEQLSSLRFDYSESVGDRVRDQLAGHITGKMSDPAARGEINTLFESDKLWTTFERMLSNWGYSSNTFAAVMTASYVGSWEIVNDQSAEDIPDGREGVEAIRDSLAVALASTPAVRNLADAKKQRTAEKLGYMLVMAVIARNQAKVARASRRSLESIGGAVDCCRVWRRYRCPGGSHVERPHDRRKGLLGNQ